MKRRKPLNSKKYISLWKPSSSGHNQDLKLSSGNEDAFCKKALDDLCLEADMAENLDEYIEIFAKGMERLLALDIPKGAFTKHELILAKILRFGEDIIEGSQVKSDLFYLGLFIDQKISSQWFKIGFYKFINKIVDFIMHKGKQLPLAIKFRIEDLVKKGNYSLYALYFIKNQSPQFKKTG